MPDLVYLDLVWVCDIRCYGGLQEAEHFDEADAPDTTRNLATVESHQPVSASLASSRRQRPSSQYAGQPVLASLASQRPASQYAGRNGQAQVSFFLGHVALRTSEHIDTNTRVCVSLCDLDFSRLQEGLLEVFRVLKMYKMC